MTENKKIKLSYLKDELSGCFCITDQNIFNLYNKFLPEQTFVLPSGEECKSFKYVEEIINKMLSLTLGKNSCIAAVGGGTVGDVAGFCASIYKRGIDWVIVPTTVTAFADSSIGGKTGINVGSVKNAVGTFYPPKKRILCHEFLSTLPKEEIQNGLVEVYKTALLDKVLFDMVFTAPLFMLVDRAADIKAKIVENDPFDTGKRRVLNLGHTVGHALELTLNIRHGAAVAIGLLIETLMSENYSNIVLEYLKKIAAPFLPINCFDIDAIVSAATNDKKNKDGIVIYTAKDIEDIQVFNFSIKEFKLKFRQAINKISNC